MLNFVNIENEIPYKDREGAPDNDFGAQIGLSISPIDFQYNSIENVSSFKAVNLKTSEILSLNTDLISANGSKHICTGLQNFDEPLKCGLYYFLINDKYESELFQIFDFDEIFPGENSIISISGLNFIDLTKDVPEWEKEGAPKKCFASQFSNNLAPLRFEYKSNEAISTFEIVKIDSNYNVIESISLNTSLVESINGTHLCSGNTDFDEFISSGIYYFLINSKYQSSVFQIFELACVVIENILVENAIEGSSGTLSFSAKLTGANIAAITELTISFSNGIDSIIDNVSLSTTSQDFSYNFGISPGKSGFCILTISNSLCAIQYQYGFNIQSDITNCLEYFGGDIFEYFGGDCLEFFE